MKTIEQAESKEKETPLLEKKGYAKLANEMVPVQQAEVYRKPNERNIEEAVKELNPDRESMESRG